MGAVSFAVGAEGSTYHNGDNVYTLTGWTLGAIAHHERFLEQRAYDALSRLKMPPDARSAASAALVEDIACFAFAYGGEKWSRSLTRVEGLAHFAWQLMRPNHDKLTLDEVLKMVEADAENVSEAVYAADPRNRATAEPLKTQEPSSKKD